jgi:hypothetical protein
MAKETNSTYRFGDDQIIRRLDVRTDKNGHAVAYLYANNNEDVRAQRQDIRSAIRLKGWGTLSDHRDGEFVLRVSGVRDGNELISMLREHGFVSGEPQVSTQNIDDAKSKGPLDFIKNNSLRLSAAIYALGDMFYFRGADNNFDRGMALSFGFGDAMLGIFGGRDDTRQFKSLLSKMKTHMEASGIEIPKNASIHVETSKQDQGAMGGVSDFLHNNINSIKIASEVVGGGFVLRSGLKRETQGPRAGKRNPFNIVSGIIIMAGWAGALLVKEKKIDKEENKPQGLVDGVARHFQEKPLRMAGYAGLSFNALKITDNIINRRATSTWSILGVSSMIGANSLYSMSNKTGGGDIKTQAMVNDVYTVASQILNKQPEDMRDKAMESVAQFLGERSEIKDTHSQIIARLKEEMAIQRANPWFEKVGLPSYVGKNNAKRDVVELGATTTSAPTAPAPVVQRDGLELAGAAQALAPQAALAQ